MVEELLKTKENIELNILSDIEDADVYNFVIESLKHETKAPYSMLLQAILHYAVDERTAKRLWGQILKNRNEMSAQLNRAVSIKTAIIDYFSRYEQKEEIIIFVKDNLVNAFNEAMKDSLTGLYSQAVIKIELEKEFKMARRYNLDLSIIFLDIDNFKDYNDRFGHINGDKLLILLSDIVKASFRGTDKCGRFGGEEFIVLLPHTKVENAYRLSKRLLRTVHKKTAETRSIPEGVTVSIGVAHITEGMASTHDLIDAADNAMYRAKREGKNRVCCAAE